MSVAIRVDGLDKSYLRMAPGFRLRTLKSALLQRSLVGGHREEDTILALEDVSFTVEKGTAFGVIGSNGSGKSTLLKILAGMLKPTRGRVEVSGKVAALIELGAGFHPEISGRENVYINGAVLGLSRKEVDRRYDDIVEFSGLADFMEEPVKNYSSGMYVRLGFSVAIHTDPEILLVDEVLAVGDEAFQHRCLRRIEEFLARGNTLLLVSHSLDTIERFSDEVLWLEKGHNRLLGSPRRVADAYRLAVAEREGQAHLAAKEARQRELEEGSGSEPSGAADAGGQRASQSPGEAGVGGVEELRRWGSGEAEVLSVRLLDANGYEKYHLESGEEVCFEIEVEAHQELRDFVFGIGVFTPRDVEVWGINTGLSGYASERLKGRTRVRLVCPALRLGPGEYLIDVAIHARDGYPYDYHRRLLSFSMTSPRRGVGVYFPRYRWEFDEAVHWKPLSKQDEGD
ncbi:MAG: ATP-binding cassette domain-containing protein [Bacteroidia bacterium]|nr:ATP-binding cassette domain-containing protein [Bacteroidia bacterium]